MFFFFFSSRRRHTRSLRDWSSDVCSSDLDSAAEVAEARRLLQAGTVRFGYLNTTVLVWDTDFAAVEAKRDLVEQTMRAARFVVTPETLNATEAFMGMVPGDFYHNVRKPLVSSMTVADV